MKTKTKFRTLKTQISESSPYLHISSNSQIQRIKNTNRRELLEAPHQQKHKRRIQTENVEGKSLEVERNEMEKALKQFDRNFKNILMSKKRVEYDKRMRESGAKLLWIYLGRIVKREMGNGMRRMKN